MKMGKPGTVLHNAINEKAINETVSITLQTILLKGILRPNTVLILNPTDRQKYRQEKFKIAS